MKPSIARPDVKQAHPDLDKTGRAGFAYGLDSSVLPNGTHMEITPFDIGVFADLGYPLVNPTGDYNGNHRVDAADYVAWRKSLAQTGVGLAADGNLNNRIDSGDYNFWRSRFGQSTGSGSGVIDAAALPEPSVRLLLLVGMVSRFGLRRIPRPFLG